MGNGERTGFEYNGWNRAVPPLDVLLLHGVFGLLAALMQCLSIYEYSRATSICFRVDKPFRPVLWSRSIELSEKGFSKAFWDATYQRQRDECLSLAGTIVLERHSLITRATDEFVPCLCGRQYY